VAATSDSERTLLQSAGRACIELVDFVGGLVRFFWQSATVVARTGFPFRIVVQQMYEIGVKSLPLTAIAALAIGMVMALQTLTLLKKFGVTQYVAVGVGLGMARELGPVVTALMVAGRAGSGISAEIGSMRVTRQIDALRILAIDPHRYLVATRIIACILVMPLLTAISDFLGIAGGALIGTAVGGITFPTYLDTTLYYLTVSDVLNGLAKTLLFGAIVGTTGAYYGFNTEGGTSGVGRSTTSTVVAASLMIFITDVIMTQLLVSLGY